MTLDEWFRKSGMKQTEAAKALGITDTHMSEVRRGKSRPSASLCLRIEELTKGAVGLRDLLAPPPKDAA